MHVCIIKIMYSLTTITFKQWAHGIRYDSTDPNLIKTTAHGRRRNHDLNNKLYRSPQIDQTPESLNILKN